MLLRQLKPFVEVASSHHSLLKTLVIVSESAVSEGEREEKLVCCSMLTIID